MHVKVEIFWSGLELFAYGWRQKSACDNKSENNDHPPPHHPHHAQHQILFMQVALKDFLIAQWVIAPPPPSSSFTLLSLIPPSFPPCICHWNYASITFHKQVHHTHVFDSTAGMGWHRQVTTFFFREMLCVISFANMECFPPHLHLQSA